MKKIILVLILSISCFAENVDKVNSEKINLKFLEQTVPLLLSSARLWANIHEEDINTFSVKKLEKVAKTREFYGIHMLTVFKYCKIMNPCID